MHFKRCGLLLSADQPVFGASSDGISSTHVLEIKCPLTAKTKQNYINAKGDIVLKVKSQMQLQMAFSGRQMGFLWVADPDFEKNKNVEIVYLSYDYEYLRCLIERGLHFWTESIWPILMSV